MTEHGTYAGGLLGPGLVLGVGFGLLFVPLQLVALTRVPEADSGRGRQPAQRRPAGGRRDRPGGAGHGGLDGGRRQRARSAVAVRWRRRCAAVVSAAYRHALAVGFDRAFLVGAGIAVLILLVAVTMIRIRRADLAGS